MDFSEIKTIREQKGISREKLCKEIGISCYLLKKLETQQFDFEDMTDELMNTLDKISAYLSDDEINPNEVNSEEVASKILEEAIEVPANISHSQVMELYNKLLKQYGKINSFEKAERFVAELKYRIGDLKPLKPEFSISDLFNQESIIEEDNIEVNEDVELKIRQDARVAAIMYKEIKSNGLQKDECLNILKILLDVIW